MILPPKLCNYCDLDEEFGIVLWNLWAYKDRDAFDEVERFFGLIPEGADFFCIDLLGKAWGVENIA